MFTFLSTLELREGDQKDEIEVREKEEISA